MLKKEILITRRSENNQNGEIILFAIYIVMVVEIL